MIKKIIIIFFVLLQSIVKNQRFFYTDDDPYYFANTTKPLYFERNDNLTNSDGQVMISYQFFVIPPNYSITPHYKTCLQTISPIKGNPFWFAILNLSNNSNVYYGILESPKYPILVNDSYPFQIFNPNNYTISVEIINSKKLDDFYTVQMDSFVRFPRDQMMAGLGQTSEAYKSFVQNINVSTVQTNYDLIRQMKS